MSQLEDILRSLGPGEADADEATDALDPVDLAAWLDGVASAEVAERVETHLARSPESRELAADVAAGFTETGLAGINPSEPERSALGRSGLDRPGLDRQESSSRTSWRLRRNRPPKLTGFVAAAALLLLALGGWRLSAWDGRLGELGVSVRTAFFEPARMATLRAALDGEWPRPSFEAFAEPSGELVLRGAEAPRAPEPLEPRWSAVRTGRPGLQVDLSSSHSAGAPRVLLVDVEERVVATFVGSAEWVEGALEMSWPPDQAALEPGVYAWKVSSEDLDVAASSAWVPFRVLSADEIGDLEARLAGVGDFEAAVLLSGVGLFDEARERLRAIDEQALRRPLLDSLDRRRQP